MVAQEAIAIPPFKALPMPVGPWLCLDIETTAGRPESADEAMRAHWTPSNNWTPETIGKRYLEALEKKRQKLALLDSAKIAVVALNSPMGRVVLHSLRDEAPRSEEYATVIGYRDEKSMLAGFRDILQQWASGETLLVGHNIKGFDLPRLRLAFVRAGLQIPDALNNHAYDCMKEFRWAFSVEGSEMVALSEVLVKLGLPNHKDLIDGSQIDQLIDAGKIETVLRYAALDVCQETEVFLRMTGRSAQLE